MENFVPILKLINDFPHIMQIRRIYSFESEKLEQLLLALSPTDRHLRFAGHVPDEIVVRYVRNLSWSKICVYGTFDRKGVLLGAVELVTGDLDTELAIEVRSSEKGKGIGNALMARALLHAKVTGLKNIQIFCTPDNATIQHMARKAGMSLRREYGSVEGLVAVGKATSSDYMAATWHEVDASMGSSLLMVKVAFQRYQATARSLMRY